MKVKETFRNWWEVLKESFQFFSKHDTATLAASLSYFTIFSIAPVIIIVISVAGLVLGPEAVQGEVKGQIQSLVGAKSADTLQEMIKAAYRPGENIPAAIIAIILLLFGAIGMFGQLRTSLNVIWDVEERKQKKIVTFIVTRLFSLAMVLTLGFLLLITMVIHAVLEGFSHMLERRLPDISVVLFTWLDNLISFGITWLLFSLIYKFMSDAKLKWKNAWRGALFTAALFIIGKYLIGLYLGKGNVADTYGAAGSVIVVLIWVFYSSHILFFGAEFTRVLAVKQGFEWPGNKLKPSVTEEKQPK